MIYHSSLNQSVRAKLCVLLSIYLRKYEKKKHTYINRSGRLRNCRENVSVVDVSLIAFSTGPVEKYGNVGLSKFEMHSWCVSMEPLNL